MSKLVVFCLSAYRFYVSLKLTSSAHDLMPAAETAQTKVHSRTKHQPALFAAGMLFLHRENIANLNIHSLVLLLDSVPIRPRRLLNLVVAKPVVTAALKRIGQVLLLNIVVRVAVRIFIVLLAL